MKTRLNYRQRAIIHAQLDFLIDWGLDAVNGGMKGKCGVTRAQIGDSTFNFTVEPITFGEKTTKIYERKLGRGKK